MEPIFEIDGKSYELHFTIDSVDKFETLTNQSIGDAFRHTFMKVGDIESFFAVGLFYVNGGAIPPQQAVEVAKEAIKTRGLVEVTSAIDSALSRDCGFLIQVPGSDTAIG